MVKTSTKQLTVPDECDKSAMISKMDTMMRLYSAKLKSTTYVNTHNNVQIRRLLLRVAAMFGHVLPPYFHLCAGKLVGGEENSIAALFGRPVDEAYHYKQAYIIHIDLDKLIVNTKMKPCNFVVKCSVEHIVARSLLSMSQQK